MLQLPQNWSKQEKIDRANMVIDCLGLDKCRDTIIGDQYMRGVSGGERKRVSIGHELLTNPSVILLDEPTSGLDSTTALKLMHTLRMLASGGRSIVTSIHQPSSRLYQQCDKLLLLAEGKTVYYGDAHVAPHWFARYGQPVPFGVSTSDHILDIACGDLPGYGAAESREIRISMVQRFTERTVGTGRSGILPADLGSDAVLGAQEAVRGRLALNASLSRDNSSAQASAPPVLRGESAKSLRRVGEVELGDGAGMGIGSVAETDMLEGGDGGTSGDSTGTSTAHTAGTMGKHVVDSDAIGIEIGDDGVADQQDTGADQKDEEEHTGPEGKVWGASWIDQVRYLSSRSVKTRRFSALSWQRVCETVIVGVLSGLFWFQLGATTLTPQVALDLGGVLFFEMLFLSFTALFQAIFNYPSEFSMVVKERQSGMYRLSAYYISRSLSDLPMDCLLPTILSIIIYFMAGLRLEPGAFFSNWWAVLLSVLIAQSAGLLIGASLKNVKNCLAVATVSMLIFMLVGGFYVRSMPVWIGWLKYCSFIYWGWNLLLKIEFSGRDMDPSACNGIDPCGVAASGTFPIDVNEPVTKEVCILISMLIFLRLVTYHVLNVKTTFKQKSG
ncbi:hypothetical protein FOA52_001810 [Chlamydomonas sp. UWO 241]|nr:hypothetical protein FOA52_001810 [Chlamydomonas sp. UWO 241]